MDKLLTLILLTQLNGTKIHSFFTHFLFTSLNGGALFNSTKKYNHIVSRAVFISCCLLTGVGCESTLDIAGGEHKTVTDKWRALSTYAESNIENYGVTITARLAVDANNNFKLTHFKISNQPSKQDINLLAPNFEDKYICSPVCYQLLEYVNFTGKNGTTLLTNYFDRHEFELFKFYGDVQLLNKEIAKLARHDQQLFKSYLISLAHQGTSFEVAKEFTQFLTSTLTLPTLENFANNPEEVFSHFLKNYQIKNKKQWNKVNSEQDGWTGVNTEQNEWTGINTEQEQWTGVNTEQNDWTGVSTEQEQWTASTEGPESAWSNETTVYPEATWLREVSIQAPLIDSIKTTNDQSLDESQLSWQLAQTYPIEIGQNVCSYQDNFFGVVTAISFDQVAVNLLGQAKRINEGIVAPAEKGDLFTLTDNLYFLPLTDKKSFKKSDVASCALE